MIAFNPSQTNLDITDLKNKLYCRSGFKIFNRILGPPLKSSGIKGRAEAANRRNIGNISRIGRLCPTQRLKPRGGFETTSKVIVP